MSDRIIPIDRWGGDHWSTLAYVETCIVDHDGRLEIRRMRCHPRVHRLLAHDGSWSDTPPTRLADDTTVDRHDDWSCLEDAIACGVLVMEDEEAILRGRYTDSKGKVHKGCSPRFQLTDLGRRIANDLRAHKGRDGSFATFRPMVLGSTAGPLHPSTLPPMSVVSTTNPAGGENR